MYPERVTWAEAEATCQQLPGGKLAVLDSQGLLNEVSKSLLETLPFQTGIRSAWVGVTGNNSNFNPAAPNMTALAAQGSSNISGLLAQAPLAQPTVATENTLTWVNGSQVSYSLLRRPVTLVQIWTGHDVVASQQFVPASSETVCGRMLVQLPPDSLANASAVTAAVTPGIWYFDCNKPAAFICQSECCPPCRACKQGTDAGHRAGGGSNERLQSSALWGVCVRFIMLSHTA